MPHFTELIDQLPRRMIVTHALQVACGKDGEGSADERRAEWLPLFFAPFDQSGELRPRFGFAGENEAEVLAKNLADTSVAQWQALAKRATSTKQHFLAALYLDFLWRTRKYNRLEQPTQFAKLAAQQYELAATERLGDDGEFWDALASARNLGRLARELSDSHLAQKALRLVIAVAEALESEWGSKPGWPLGAARAVIAIVASFRAPDRTAEMKEAVEATLRFLERYMPPKAPLEASHTGRDVFDVRSTLDSLAGRDTKVQRAQESARSLMDDAEARAGRGDFLAAGMIMTDAVRAFTALGQRDLAATAKRRSREMFGQAQMTTVTATTVVSVEELNTWIDEATRLASLSEVLRHASSSEILIPEWSAIEAAVEEAAKTYVFAAMVPSTTLVDGRAVSRESDGKGEMLRREWLIQMKQGVHLHWRKLLQKLAETGRLSPEAFLQELDQAGLVLDHNRSAFARALDAAFNGDHLVACHMLPSLLEASLRQLFFKAGVDTTAFRPRRGGQIQERTMGAWFSDEDDESGLPAGARKILGNDLWHWFRQVLFDERSINIRNRAAHGLLADSECEADTTNMLLLGFSALLPPAERSRSPTSPTASAASSHQGSASATDSST